MAENIDDIMKIIGTAIERYRPGGEFSETRASELAEKKRIAIPQMQAGLVSRGLAGTTVAAAIPSRFEMETAKPWQTETEKLRSSALMDAILAKAGFMERESGRDLQLKLAREEADLRQRLQNQQISSQQFIALLENARARSRNEALAERNRIDAAGGGGGAGGDGGGTTGGYGSSYGGVGTTYSEVSGGAGGGSYADPLAGQPMFTAEGGVGMYLGGQRSLSGEQVDWGQNYGDVPNSTAEATQRISSGGAGDVYSPGDFYVGGSDIGGTITSKYRTSSGKIVPGPLHA
ncbi:hypothetical protein LCGC14_0359980 [marine sediment metagenome]|uniref:Uncharacterized protein n=1 Tax=marine sediment metagenome TaxID=412755 RepID=A0A0F9TE31_9ZZZZ